MGVVYAGHHAERDGARRGAPDASAQAAGKAGTAHFAVKTPTIPIPFHKLLKVVALVDGRGPADTGAARPHRRRELRDRVSDRFDRDVSEDAAVGAYIALDRRRAPRAGARAWRSAVRGDRLPARRSGRSPIRTGSPTSPVLGMTGEVDGYIYLGQQTPGVLRQAGRREPRQVRHEPAAAVLRRAHGLRRRGQHRLRLPGPPGRPVLPQVARRPALLQALRRAASSATTCATPTSTSATC